MIERTSTESENLPAFRNCLDHIGALFVITEAVNNDCSSIGEDCLDSKFAPPSHGRSS